MKKIKIINTGGTFSSNATDKRLCPEDWHNLAERIGHEVDNYDDIVIIHGTDTMAYTASMLSFMLQNIPIPVVMTGSQMPLGVPMSDAEENFWYAVWMALSKICTLRVRSNKGIRV